MKKVNKQIKITLGIMIPLLIGYFIYVNYWEYIENLLWNEDYDQRAMNFNSNTDIPTPWHFKYECKDLYKGLDLSHHNKIVDFDALGKYDFIYHKATEGNTFVDPKFNSRINQFVRMGIPCGAYHFFTTGSSGKAQFKHFKSVVSKNYPLIPVLDIEINKNGWSKKKLNKELSTWINLCEKYYGVKPIIYSSSHFYIKYDLKQHGCMFWSGDINSKSLVKPCIHQKKLVKVTGIIGKVDYNEACDIFINPYSTYNEF